MFLMFLCSQTHNLRICYVKMPTRNSNSHSHTNTENQTKQATCKCRSFTVAIIIGACN